MRRSSFSPSACSRSHVTSAFSQGRPGSPSPACCWAPRSRSSTRPRSPSPRSCSTRPRSCGHGRAGGGSRPVYRCRSSPWPHTTPRPSADPSRYPTRSPPTLPGIAVRSSGSACRRRAASMGSSFRRTGACSTPHPGFSWRLRAPCGSYARRRYGSKPPSASPWPGSTWPSTRR